jgi:hypothetical protein
MRHADAQGANRVGHPVPMAMIVLSLMTVEMDMGIAVVVMAMQVPTLAVELNGQGSTEHDQQYPNPRLGNEFELRWDVNPQDQHDRPYDQQGQRMADPPP